MAQKILIVEDECDLRELYARQFAKAGYEVDQLEKGDTVIDAIKNTSYDMVLLDVMLPGLNGIGVLRMLREDDQLKNMPIIMISNLGDEKVIQEAKKLGILDYIIKATLTPRQIVEKVSQTLQKIQA